MMCLYMGEINGKRYCLAGICDKELCEDMESCAFYVDFDKAKRDGIWDGFGREEEGEGNEVGSGLPPIVGSSSVPPPVITAEPPISSSCCKWCEGD